jgi:hypothetical protein
MYIAVLPRKVVGVIFCVIGAVAMIEGIFGESSGNGGQVFTILVGALFGGTGWMAIKSSTRQPKSSLAEQRGNTVDNSVHPLSIPVVPSASLVREGEIGFGKSPRNAHWTHAVPTKSGWYWYRSNWEGKQEDPELIYCTPETQSRVAEFVTAGGVYLFPEDIAKMSTEFWTEPVMPPQKC